MDRKNELAKNTVILSLGKFAPRLFALITTPLITAKLTKSEFGTYDLITTLVMLLMPVVTLQIQSAAFRFLIKCRDDRGAASEIITSIIVFTIPIAIVSSVAAGIVFPAQTITIRVLVSLYLFLDILNATFSQIVRGLGHNAIFTISAVILSLTNCIGVFALLSFSESGLAGVLAALCLANTASFFVLFLFVRIWRYTDIQAYSRSSLKKLIAYSWPLIPNNISGWVLKLSDRIVITAFLGIEANAVYAAANKIPNLLSIAQTVFVMAWHENASLTVKDKDADKYYSDMFMEIYDLCIGISALLTGCMPYLFTLLIKGDYSEAYLQMPILILGMFFWCLSSFHGGIYIAHEKTKSVGITTIAAAMINLLLDLGLVKKIGIYAGSVSTLVAYLFLFIFRMIDVGRFRKIDYDFRKLFISFMLLVSVLVLSYIDNSLVRAANMLFGFLLFVILNRGFIKRIYLMVKKVFNKDRGAEVDI